MITDVTLAKAQIQYHLGDTRTRRNRRHARALSRRSWSTRRSARG